MVKSLRNFHICDFETLNLEDDCRVWAWASCSLFNTDRIELGTSIESFLAYLKSYKKLTLFFHNLKFDSDFIINYLLHEGYEVVPEKRFLSPKSLTTTVSKMGQFYTVEVMFENGNRVTIFDSLKKLPFKVREIAKAFNLQMAKGSIDYDQFRPIDYILSPEEIDYIKKDVKIVAEALKVQYEEGMDGITVSKDCLNDYIATIGGENRFRNLFPVISLELFDDMKQAYRGGWVYVKDSIAGKMIGKGQTFDYNSMYPSVMDEKPLPFGMPVSFTGEYKFTASHPLYIQKLECEFEIKKNHLPMIQIKGQAEFKASEYLTSSQGTRVTLYLTNIDLKLFFDHYDVLNPEYISGWMFKQQTGMFTKYITKHMFVKEKAKGAKRSLAKLKLNGLYGKFGSELNVTGKLPYLKSDGSTGYRLKSMVEVETLDGKTRMKEFKNLREYQEGVYLPIAIFTTSYARDKIIRASQKVYKRFCYADTDSIHITGLDTPEEMKPLIHESRLGYLKRESQFVRAKFLRPKTYIEEECVLYQYDENGEISKDEYGDDIYKEVDYGKHNATRMNVKCAGLDDQAKPYVTFKNFYIGSHIDVPEHAMKLRPKHVKGGTILEKKEINIREQMFMGK